MVWLGLFALIVFYWCFFTAIVTGRRSWIWLGVLCVPVLTMAIGYKTGMQINLIFLKPSARIPGKHPHINRDQK